jgi:hypothetical protein
MSVRCMRLMLGFCSFGIEIDFLKSINRGVFLIEYPNTILNQSI